MNILFLADNFPPERNAQASRVYERACYWRQWGHSVTVITGFPNFPEGRIFAGYKNKPRQVCIVDGIRVVRVKTFIAPNSGKLLRIIDFISFMASATAFGSFEQRPDVVSATSPQLFAAVAGWALSLAHRVPFVMEISDLWPDSIVAVGALKKRIAIRCLERLELFLYARAKKIIALTYSFKNNLVSRGVDPEKIDVIQNGVDLTRYAPQGRDVDLANAFGLSSDHFVIGYIGTLGMAHRLENVLRTAALIRNPTVRFLFVGPGAEREGLMAKSQQLGLTNVVFAPPQPKERMCAVWSLCDVALVHLRNAALFQTVIPSKIFEAMAMGLPILVASPPGEASDIVEQERCGFAVPAEDPEALASAAELLANDAATCQYFTLQSRLAAPKYTRERQAREMLLALEKAVQNAAHYLEPSSPAKVREHKLGAD